jgi:hypothetical protein
MALTELKFGTKIRWFDALNSKVRNFGFVVKESGNLARTRTLIKNTSLKHKFSCCGPNWTCESILERFLLLDDFQLGLDGHLCLWLTPQSGQELEFPIQGMMVLYWLEILSWWWSNPRILVLSASAWSRSWAGWSSSQVLRMEWQYSRFNSKFWK